MPRDSGWSSTSTDFASSVATTGAWMRSANARSASAAPETITPRSATITGRCAAAMASAARRTAAGIGRGPERRKARVHLVGDEVEVALRAGVSASPVRPAMSRCTGRGVPVVASRNAWRIRCGICSSASICAWNLVTAAIQRRRARPPGRRCGTGSRATWRPVNAITGEWPRYGSCSAAARLAAPTDCAMQMPGLPDDARVAVGHVGDALSRNGRGCA